MKFFRYFFVLFLLIGLFAFAKPSYARDSFFFRDYGYKAQFVSQSVDDPIEIEAGETKTVEISFKNVGTKTWSSTASRFVSAYAVESKYRNSDFAGPNWLSTKQTAKISGVVAPGQTGTLTLELTAPKKIGTYKEWFHLAAENYSWVKGGYFYLRLNVVPATATEEVEPSHIDTEPADSEQKELEEVKTWYQAKVYFKPKATVYAKGGEKISSAVIYGNTGDVAWEGHSLRASAPTALAGSTLLTYADSSWKDRSIINQVSTSVAGGSNIRKEFSFRAPQKKGSYDMTVYLETAGESIPGSEVHIHVNVTADAPDHYQAPQFSQSSTVIPPATYRMDEEPMIRVGVWKVDENYVLFQSTDDSYIIYDGTTKKGVLPKGTKATLSYKGYTFKLVTPDLVIEDMRYVRLMPEHNVHAVFSVLNYERKVSWKGPYNFNTYRGGMELRYTEDKEAIYVINELLVEDYMKGVGENSDGSNKEYLQAQTVAQRTYAYYIKAFSGKHDSRYFDVVAHTGDQLYLGYENERIMPNFSSAVNKTRGFMVTYDDDIVITPYFARTDGRTRSWVEAGWGREEKPWLVSVKAEYDASRGRSLLGHGVGMSQVDAVMRAEEEKLTWEELITYYYTGTVIEKMYK
ncbi:hypothetical protein KKG22_04215 [Patescibacteria group bacterium]|nr:hypothetical protein [Patescibacteria group bacterium]MBU1721347.1 hypothetical protein [Patescibacteria group bacterium]MBU1901555.1 hypothetical protein [Patescibacteria group bacterium]